MILLYIYQKNITMKFTTELRDQLGISQDLLAQYLVIPLSQLAMYETGKRELPAESIEKLAPIVAFLEKLKTKNKPILNHEALQLEKATSFLESEAKLQELNQQILKNKLAKFQKKYNQKLNLMHLANHLNQTKITHNEPTPKNKIEALWLQVIAYEADAGLERYGLHHQIKIEAALQATTKVHQQILSLKNKVESEFKILNTTNDT